MIPVRALALLCCCSGAVIALQAQPVKHAPNDQPKDNVFEDDEVRVTIPAGWSRTMQASPSSSVDPSRLRRQSDSGRQNAGLLLLQKDGYTLTLDYLAEQASGVEGGRIIEEFAIPWPTGPRGDIWACAVGFRAIAQAAGRTLLFENLIVDTDHPSTRDSCGIAGQVDAAPDPTGGNYTGKQRWFGGYFTIDGGYFFSEWPEDHAVRSRSYSLTTSAKTVNDLPIPDNAHLAEIVQQAIGIVNSIEYKKHPLKLASPLRTNLPW